jgi:signal transduction histidine kinase
MAWSVDTQGRAFEITGDLNNLKLAFSNVIHNSFEAMASGGNITISVCEAEGNDDMVLVTFVDSGSGISKPDLPNVFDPFFTSKMSGPGMGLTIVHRIVTRHSGEVEITSVPGEGTTVTISLPKTQDKFI